MTRKDYELIAGAIQWVKATEVDPEDPPEKVIAKVADGLAFFLKKDNPSFDRIKFYDACGFPGRGDA